MYDQTAVSGNGAVRPGQIYTELSVTNIKHENVSCSLLLFCLIGNWAGAKTSHVNCEYEQW